METIKYKYIWISEFSQKSPMFRSLYFKICCVLDKNSNTKVVALGFLYKFSIDQFSSVAQNLREKLSWKSSKPKTLTETFGPFWNSNFSSKYFKIHWESGQTPNMKLVAQIVLYNFHIHKILSTVENRKNYSFEKWRT